MMKLLLAIAMASSLYGVSQGHGHVTFPPSRNGGVLERAADCLKGECMWFSQPDADYSPVGEKADRTARIAGDPTLNKMPYRTYNIKVSSGAADYTKTSPWRAPGSAPVRGSGCGVAGGGPFREMNGGTAREFGWPQNMDGKDLPKLAAAPPVWKRGSVAEVAWANNANHGGGYAYRLCKNVPGQITEECFQRGHLDFAGGTQWLQVWDPINTTATTAAAAASAAAASGAKARRQPTQTAPTFPVGTTGNGTCGQVVNAGQCGATAIGYFEGAATLAACVAKAGACGNYVSWGHTDHSCAWYQTCDMGALCTDCAKGATGSCPASNSAHGVCPVGFKNGFTSEVVKSPPAPPAPPPPGGGGYVCVVPGPGEDVCMLAGPGTTTGVPLATCMETCKAGPPPPPARTSTRHAIARVTASVGTFPHGSQWARIPIPACRYTGTSKGWKGCDYDCAGCCATTAPIPRDPRINGSWWRAQDCIAGCAGNGLPSSCPADGLQFPEPIPGLSSLWSSWLWCDAPRTEAEMAMLGDTPNEMPCSNHNMMMFTNIVDHVQIPADIDPGAYLLSWRWDSEQTNQIWQNCADVTIA